jgi:hypothetical protein
MLQQTHRFVARTLKTNETTSMVVNTLKGGGSGEGGEEVNTKTKGGNIEKCRLCLTWFEMKRGPNFVPLA